MVGAATAKLREPKRVRTRGTDNKLETKIGKYPAKVTRVHDLFSSLVLCTLQAV